MFTRYTYIYRRTSYETLKEAQLRAETFGFDVDNDKARLFEKEEIRYYNKINVMNKHYFFFPIIKYIFFFEIQKFFKLTNASYITENDQNG